ncbi:CinA family protein [Pseudogemmobacter sp. W21_MBD1_M6]|uniref:CinA family protein n=1 Tax=Pseudogemmobacter sp. W21_MBD1_M6 TaxID=3240271 RepID=UPI003F97D4D1
MSRALDLFTAFNAKGYMIATAESCTGGMVAAAITDIAGSSAVFDRGFITYSNDAKIRMLGVRAATLKDHGAVSEQVAIEMANGALSRSDADVAIAVTGIAGPGGSEFKPEGRVCFALAQDQAETYAITLEFGAIGRADVRVAAVQQALSMLILAASS